MVPVPILIIIPTYNERGSLGPAVEGVLAAGDCAVLVVDDASPDDTGRLADELASEYGGRMQVLHRAGPPGLGRAYLEGLRAALRSPAQVIGQMDADLSHDPAQLPALVAATQAADLVIGSRYVGGADLRRWSAGRRLLSGLGNFYVRSCLRLPIRDCTSGFRVWRRSALERLPLERMRSHGHAFLAESTYLAHRLGQRIVELPVAFARRRRGASKLGLRSLLEFLWLPWSLRRL
jgi:dolichol-phosphate mannosyltransferase